MSHHAAPEMLRGVLHVLLQLACGGLRLSDPYLNTPIGEHVTAEAIAVLQVGRAVFFPSAACRRELLLRLLTRAHHAVVERESAAAGLLRNKPETRASSGGTLHR